MDADYLSRCVVDTSARKFYLYSEQGDEQVVDCDTMEQFMSVLEYVRATAPESVPAYADPL